MSVRIRVSLFILLILGLHALPVLSYQGNRQTRWPFLAWAMYAQSRPAGPVEALDRQVVATTRHGTKRVIGYWNVGLSSPAFTSLYLAPFGKGDTAAARSIVDRLDRIGPDSIAELRMETVVYRLVDSGVAVDTLPPVVYSATPPVTR